MRLQLAQIGESDFFDYCIIGTGPAGISCALALLPTGKRILLLEGGGGEATEQSQSLYEGTTIGDRYFALDWARMRYLGGSSNHWTGFCRTLEPTDFEAKGGFPLTEWPIRKPDLDPFLAEASGILEISAIAPDKLVPDSGFRRIRLVTSPPVRFREKYDASLSTASRLFLVLNANLVALLSDGAAVTGARIVDFGGNETMVRARQFVLAAGGIENSRLLLWSNALSNGALIRNAAALGRYWTEHPEFMAGEAVLAGETASQVFNQEYTTFSSMPATLGRERILNCVLKCIRTGTDDSERIIADLARVAPAWAGTARDLAAQGQASGAAIHAAWEQEPVAENRVELGDEKDALGIPKVRLHWRKSATDLRTAGRTAMLFAEYLARYDVGRFRLDEWALAAERGEAIDLPPAASCHHMGGTRMARAPTEGIVDRNCKVFGQENLHIAGSSVFPSGGYCNPTLTIVQLALRLGEHLRAHG